jgi:putative ABC transport system permease protein
MGERLESTESFRPAASGGGLIDRRMTMFDLEKSIRAWKRSLHKQETLEDGTIADLEIHLRDIIDELKSEGIPEDKAYHKAVARVGGAEIIAAECGKVREYRLDLRSPWRPSRFMPTLLGNHLKIALRKIRRHKGYSVLNISGLAVGMASCILILLWVRDELSFDRHFQNAERVYRLVRDQKKDNIEKRSALVPYIAAPTFASEIPEIEAYTRVMMESARVFVDGKSFDERNIGYVDSAFFKIFSHPFIAGDPATALVGSGSIVLTEETANRFFGRSDVLGETLNFNKATDFRVTGVIRNMTENSHLKFTSLVSFSTFESNPWSPDVLTAWGFNHGWAYLLVKNHADPEEINRKMASVAEKHSGGEARSEGVERRFWLQSLLDIHLRSRLESEIGENGDIRAVYAFSIIAAFILGIACINFINLATARSAKHSKEVGVRKVLGAQRKNLVSQFLEESIMMSVLAMVAAILLVKLALPLFNALSGKNLSVSSLMEGIMGIGIVGLTLLTGIISGSYPALFLSAFHPVAVMKGVSPISGKRSSLRRILVVFQFALSVILITATFIMVRQLQYMKTRNLGFDKDQVLVINIRDADESTRRNIESVKTEFLQNPEILEASLSDGLPGDINITAFLSLEGRPEKESARADVIIADYDFAETYGIDIVQGRDFSKEFSADAKGAFLINEIAAERLGWGRETLGKKIGFNPDEMGTIVGIMKNFHFRSLQYKIEPLAVLFDRERLNKRGYYLSLRLRGGNIAGTVDFIRSKWAMRSEGEFNYFFANDFFDSLYRNEERVGTMISIFATLAILVACLGLIGLVSYSVEQRTKEIGIRKILGASEIGLALLLSEEFLKWVLLANAFALPAANFFMTRYWLSNFAYRASFGLWNFGLIVAISILIALLTVGYQTLRAALANPSESLKYE